ncbi:MAG: hypothetical protein HYZ37_01660 [Candidatus Solibacter usitatus]|nr:hypothetical protein [Candidatus Solibacter usitatus]
MESTLNALGGILLNATPTFFLIIFLHFYLKSFFFKPLEKVLRERDDATTGARRKANESLSEIYKEQEEQRKQWKAERDVQIAAAQQSAKAMVEAAKAGIAAEADAAKQSLEAQSRQLASQIADSMMEGKAA